MSLNKFTQCLNRLTWQILQAYQVININGYNNNVHSTILRNRIKQQENLLIQKYNIKISASFWNKLKSSMHQTHLKKVMNQNYSTTLKFVILDPRNNDKFS